MNAERRLAALIATLDVLGGYEFFRSARGAAGDITMGEAYREGLLTEENAQGGDVEDAYLLMVQLAREAAAEVARQRLARQVREDAAAKGRTLKRATVDKIIRQYVRENPGYVDEVFRAPGRPRLEAVQTSDA